MPAQGNPRFVITLSVNLRPSRTYIWSVKKNISVDITIHPGIYILNISVTWNILLAINSCLINVIYLFNIFLKNQYLI